MNVRLSAAGAALRAACLAAALAALGACSTLGKLDEAAELYTLTPKSRFDEGLPNVFWQLTVDTPVAPANVNTGRILLAQTATSSDYYANAAWTDRAPLMVQTLIIDSFENSKRIVAVSRDTIGLRANYILQTDLREFQAEYYHGGPPIVRVRIAAKIVRMPDRQIIGARGFERCYRAKENKLPAIVRAYDDALGSVLRRLVGWTLATPPARPLPDDTALPIERFRDPRTIVEDSRGCPSFGQPIDVPQSE